MVRYSLNFVSWKLRKAVAADLRTIYTAATIAEAEMRLVELRRNGVPATRRSSNPGSAIGRASCRLRLPGRNPKGDLYHQCDRVGQHESAQSYQKPRLI